MTDEDDEAPDWEEVDPEGEKEGRGGVLGRTAPLARIVFGVILVVLIVGTVIVLILRGRRWFGG